MTQINANKPSENAHAWERFHTLTFQPPRILHAGEAMSEDCPFNAFPMIAYGVDEMIAALVKPVATPVKTTQNMLRKSKDSNVFTKAGIVVGGTAWGLVKGIVGAPLHLVAGAPLLGAGVVFLGPTLLVVAVAGACLGAKALDEKIGASD